jgi:serine/threonine protein kinase
MSGTQGSQGTHKKPQVAVQDAFIGKSLHRGEYIIEATIGRGGMGQVFLASHRSLDVPVAVKQARADQPLPESVRAELDHLLSQEPDKVLSLANQVASPDFPLSGGSNTDRFLREALLLARLRHPAIPTLYDYFLEDGYWYLVMEYVPGPTLANYIRQNAPLPPLEALNYAMQLCDVLDYLHRQAPPIVFRDLKPSNVILSPEGRLILIDFGIARYFKEGQINDTTDFGSPGYASPEQYEGNGQTDGRSDLYSLGVILYEMLSGKRPGRNGKRSSSIEALHAINPAFSPALSGLVAIATRSEPMYRFQAAGAFYAALERTRMIEERRAYHRHALLADEDETTEAALPSAQTTVAPDAIAPPPPHLQRAHARTPLPQPNRKDLEQEALAMQLASLDDSLKHRAISPSTPPAWTKSVEDDTAHRSQVLRRALLVMFIITFLIASVLASFLFFGHFKHAAHNSPPALTQQPTQARQTVVTTQGSWQALPSLPSPQADNTASYVIVQGRGYIYLSGGYRGADAHPHYARGLFRYDIAAAHWETLNVPGLPAMGNNSAAVDEHGHIFFTGGYSADTNSINSLIYLYDPLQNTLQKIVPPSPVKLGFGGAMVADQQGHLYFTSGFATPGNPQTQAGTGWYRYTIATGKWETLAPLPTGAGYVILAPDGNGGILMIGGSRDAGQHQPISQIYRYDALHNTWVLEPVTTPTAISGAASCLDGQGHLIITGGYDAVHGSTLASSWLVSLSTLSWQMLPALPSGGSLLGAAACDGNGHTYLERGANNAGQPTSDFMGLTL